MSTKQLGSTDNAGRLRHVGIFAEIEEDFIQRTRAVGSFYEGRVRPRSLMGHVENPVCGVLRLDPWRIELYDLLNPHNRRVWYAEGEQTPLS